VIVVVRLSVRASAVTDARSAAARAERILGLGALEILRLEPDAEFPGYYSLDLRSHAKESDAVSLLQAVTRALVSGPWLYREANPDEPWAVWDGRSGGRPALEGAAWAAVEICVTGIDPTAAPRDL
jgi:hypothetical protein